MSIALIGIIALQAYWIRQAVQLNEVHFDTSVNDALNEVVERLSKQELAVTMFGVYAGKERNDFVFDSLHNDTGLHEWEENKTSVLIQLQKDADHLLDEHLTWIESSADGEADTFFSQQTTVSVEVDNHSSRMTKIQANKVIVSADPSKEEPKTKDNKRRTIKIKEAENLFFNTLVELKASNMKLEDRIDSVEIAKLVDQSLQTQGLTGITHEFAVSVKPEDRLVFVNKNTSIAEFKNTQHCVRLFDGLGLGEQYELCLYFPNQGLYTLRRIGWLAAGALIFTSIILFCFWLSIRTIFHQKKLSEMKNDFINNMTHELKTPLATISLAADSLATPMVQVNPGQITHYTEIIKDENRRMHRQVERVLQAARFDRRDVQLKEVPIDLHELIEQVVHPFQLQITEKQGKLELSLDAENVNLKGDKIHLTNIISNLLDNANKYSPEKPEIFLTTRNEGNHIIMSVADKGVGIPPAEQNHIFDRFYRVSSGNLHEVKGFGLGLSYVKEIVETHGGDVSVRSTLGKGSTFVVRLPLERD